MPKRKKPASVKAWGYTKNGKLQPDAYFKRPGISKEEGEKVVRVLITEITE